MNRSLLIQWHFDLVIRRYDRGEISYSDYQWYFYHWRNRTRGFLYDFELYRDSRYKGFDYNYPTKEYL